MGKVIGLLVLAAIGGVVYMALPDLKRYFKLRNM
jgi:hypothetical protein